MLTSRLAAGVKEVPKILRRNIGIMAPALQKASDPIQQLFIDKIREYTAKTSGGKTLEPIPELEKERASELEKTAKQFGGGPGVDMTQFPSFKFEEPKVDPINLQN